MKILYHNWIAELGHDPNLRFNNDEDVSDTIRTIRIRRGVRAAIDRLAPREKEVAERYYFMGETYSQIAEALHRPEGRIAKIHRVVQIKLRNNLASLVKELFNIKLPQKKPCVICDSPYIKEINSLISSKKKKDSWRGIIKELKTKYKIEIKTPQSLIGHRKYHMED